MEPCGYREEKGEREHSQEAEDEEPAGNHGPSYGKYGDVHQENHQSHGKKPEEIMDHQGEPWNPSAQKLMVNEYAVDG